MNSQRSAGGGIRPRGIPSGNPHPVSPGPDFESGASANSTTPAKMLGKHDKSTPQCQDVFKDRSGFMPVKWQAKQNEYSACMDSLKNEPQLWSEDYPPGRLEINSFWQWLQTSQKIFWQDWQDEKGFLMRFIHPAILQIYKKCRRRGSSQRDPFGKPSPGVTLK